MVDTYGLTHIALTVKDPERSVAFYTEVFLHAEYLGVKRSVAFYTEVFGVKEYYRDDEQIQVTGPGKHDVIAFEKGSLAGKAGGIAHFGFRLKRPADIDLAVSEAQRAGGRLLRRGEFAPGFPFAYVADPDGYEIEIWYE